MVAKVFERDGCIRDWVSDVLGSASGREPGQARPKQAGPGRAKVTASSWLLAWPEVLKAKARPSGRGFHVTCRTTRHSNFTINNNTPTSQPPHITHQEREARMGTRGNTRIWTADHRYQRCAVTFFLFSSANHNSRGIAFRRERGGFNTTPPTFDTIGVISTPPHPFSST